MIDRSPSIRTTVRRLRTPALLAAGLVAVLPSLAPAPAAAELVVLDDGRFFKVRALDRDGARMRLELAEGGRITLPLARIAHVVDDEWVPSEPEPELPAPAEPVAWLFDEGVPVPQVPYGELIYDAARRHGLHPELVSAVVATESAFEPTAVSHAGAQGLMQLMPATAERFGVRGERVFDPATNLDAGTRYLAWLMRRFEGDLPKALAGYNAGEGTVDRYQGVPPYRETRGYIRKIYTRLGLAQTALAGVL